MRDKKFYKRCRQFSLWLLLIAVIYCWKRPELYLILIGIYGIFLVVNQYYAYLEEKETQKQQLGRAFQPQVFHKNYMKEERSIIKLEILLLGMMVLIALFWR